MKRRLNLHLKENTMKMLHQLADDSGIKNIQVYICKKLIIPYSRRIDPNQEHAKNPIPNKLVYSDENKTICTHIMLDESEEEALKKLIEYHYFMNITTGKPRYSVFIACLIHYQYDKKFKQQSVVESIEPTSNEIDLDLMNPNRFF